MVLSSVLSMTPTGVVGWVLRPCAAALMGKLVMSAQSLPHSATMVLSKPQRVTHSCWRQVGAYGSSIGGPESSRMYICTEAGKAWPTWLELAEAPNPPAPTPVRSTCLTLGNV